MIGSVWTLYKVTITNNSTKQLVGYFGSIPNYISQLSVSVSKYFVILSLSHDDIVAAR